MLVSHIGSLVCFSLSRGSWQLVEEKSRGHVEAKGCLAVMTGFPRLGKLESLGNTLTSEI